MAEKTEQILQEPKDIQNKDPLKGMTRNERKIAINTAAGVLPEQKTLNGMLQNGRMQREGGHV